MQYGCNMNMKEDGKPTSDVGHKKVRVLLVEDQPIAARAAMIRFDELGCHVELAEDGKSAYELASSHQYDLILMDIGLPDISGLEVTRLIRMHESSLNKRRVPIVALTAHAYGDIYRDCLEAAMDMVITKPFLAKEGKKMLDKFHLIASIKNKFKKA